MAGVILKNLWKKYGKVEAVKGIHLNIEDQEFVAFLGPSGCGKTSTMRMIAGLEKITSGEIYIGDRLVNNLDPAIRNIAMAFESYALYPPMTVFENIAFPLRAMKFPENVIREKVQRITEILELTDVLNKYPKGLSGGHQQRVSLARALIRDADVYLLDEPISHLDTKMRNRMRAELKRIHSELGKTMIYVTHDQIEALAMADKVVVMNFGVIHQVGTPADIYFKPQDLFVADFVGEPPMNFIDCTVGLEEESFNACFDQFHIKIADKTKQSVLADIPNLEFQSFILGIRPSNIDIIQKDQMDQGTTVEGRIFTLEPLGDSKIVHVLLGDKQLLVETSPDFIGESDDVIRLRFHPDHLLLFDKKSEKAIFL
ncbi:MAG: ABC transporter ATP-binding protein [Candidatus Atribacteria bacterium]|nr:ABC transporter ATP-binding protein [Candidatus Atribacteria bacterium]